MIWAVYTDDYGNNMMVRRIGREYHAVRTVKGGMRDRDIRGINPRDTAKSCQESLDRYADRKGFRFAGELNDLERDWA